LKTSTSGRFLGIGGIARATTPGLALLRNPAGELVRWGAGGELNGRATGFGLLIMVNITSEGRAPEVDGCDKAGLDIGRDDDCEGREEMED